MGTFKNGIRFAVLMGNSNSAGAWLGNLVAALIVPFVILAMNHACNRGVVVQPTHTTISRATGWIGHKDYTRYPDGSVDLKTYPDYFGHFYFSTKLFQDLDGDGLTDRIRVNGPAFQMWQNRAILSRDTDYNTKRGDFLRGDTLIKEWNKIYKEKNK